MSAALDPRRTLHLVPTERHAERARARGLWAQPVDELVLRCAQWGSARPAARSTTRLATALALERVTPEGMRMDPGHSAGPAGRTPARTGPAWALACALDDALGALRLAGTCPGHLVSLRDPRAELLGRLLEGANGLLARAGLFDAREAGFVAAQCIARAAASDLPARVVVDSCFAWNQADFAWVEALAARTKVSLRMPHCHSGKGEQPAAFWDDSVVERIEERWHSLATGAPEIELVDLTCPVPHALIEAAHDEAECRAVVWEVAQALRAGADPERIGIVVPDLDETFVEPLRAYLIEASIPYSEPRGRPPIASPVVAAALRWASLLELPIHRDDVIDLLEAAVIDPKAWIPGQDRWTRRRRALELAHVLAQVPIGADPDGTLLSAATMPSEEGGPEPQTWMRRSWNALLAQLAGDRREDRRHVLAERVRSACERLGLYEVSPETFELGVRGAPAGARAGSHALRARLSLQEAASAMRALEGALAAVESSAVALGLADETIGVARFRAELEAALGSVAAQPGLRRAGTVQVIRGPDASSQDWDLLVVTRASEGTFGAMASATNDPLLDETVLSRLPSAERPQARRISQTARTLELSLAMSRAARLVLTRRRSDPDGRPDPPVPLFAEWAERLPPLHEPPSAIRSSRTVSERMHVCRELARSHSSALSRVGPDVTLRTRVEIERQHFFFDPTQVAGACSGSIDLGGPRVRAHLAQAFGGSRDRPISATAIERAANCRFAAWAERVLGARTEHEAGEAVDPSQRGSIVHAALKMAMDATSCSPSGLEIDAEIARVMALVRASILKPPVSLLYAAEVDRSLLDVEAVLRWSLESAHEYRYSRGEQSFGAARDEWKALQLCAPPVAESASTRPRAPDPSDPSDPTDLTDLTDSAHARSRPELDVYVRGCIDRIDLSADGARLRVMDYKTGSTPLVKQIGVLYFQPLLYAAVAVRELGARRVRGVSGLYVDTKKRPVAQVPGERSQALTAEALQAAQEAAVRIVHRVWAGDIAPRASDARACLHCSSRVICRKPATAPDFDPSSDEGHDS